MPEDLVTVPAISPQEAFSAFYREYTPKLIGSLLNRGARMEDAAEVAQETMTKAWQSWSAITFAPAWVFKVGLRDYGQRMASVHETPIDDASERSALIAADSDIDQWVENNHYHRMILSLPPRQRQVMQAHLLGLTDPQIARELAMDPATVRSHLRKARRALIVHREGGKHR
ncbi:RNA polymerase sigma factor [Nocardia jejuensis]|uniref:RNA polymerase sigma factor n=1 Tax=Nocardia jejuensis TaxID=328049 RepID=UPI000837330B|nr:sigma-70 family RNA polymerase sigma factor [Nocardia jejuensis]